jgi:hypothetical protein
VAKSVISALIGIALHKRHIKSVDQKLFEFFPEYFSAETDQRKKEISLKHLFEPIGISVRNSANQSLHKPLGISVNQRQQDRQKYYIGGYGLILKARDPARIMALQHDDAMIWWSDRPILFDKELVLFNYRWWFKYNLPVNWELEPLVVKVSGIPWHWIQLSN